MATTARYANGHIFDHPRDIGDGHRSENSFASVSAADYDSFEHYTQGSRTTDIPKKPLTTRECVELFHETVENARQTYAKSMSNEKTPEQLKPTLTLEMSRKGIQQIPTEVVHIIRQDVERLQLSHNHLRSISNDFGTCSALRYLNLRGNRFSVIPQALFALHQLEILDVSKNELTEVSDEIGNLKVLRVLSIRHNQLKDLPLCIGSFKSMRMLRLDENPWNPELTEVIQEGESSYRASSSGRFDESECDRHLTPFVTDYLKKKQSEIDSPLETPRALSRFPVNPNDSGYITTGSDSGTGSRSPGILKSRTHSRATSSQVSQPRRPSLTPLTLQDKMRSTSESHLHPTTQIKSKRMGIIPKKKPELEVLDETGAHRNSFHLRGQSHSSALRNVTRAGEHSPADENRLSGQKGTFVRRLSSVPEQKQSKMSDSLVESAKGILYSLHTMQPYLASVVTLAQDSRSRSSSLERFQHQASVQLEFLDQSVQELELAMVKGKSKRAQNAARKTVCRATHTSMSIFTQIGGILVQNVHKLVAHGDRRYIRGLMVVLWGSIIEQRNARRKLVPPHALGTLPSTMKTSNRPVRDDALTPTQDNLKTGRNRSESPTQAIQNPTNIAAVVSSRPPTSHSTISSRANSRSSSRTGMYYPSSATSFANTPRSGDSFGANMFPPRSRAGSLSVDQHRARKNQEESDQFERIYKTLNKAVDKGITAINQLEPRFMKSFEDNQQIYVPMEVKNLWQEIVGRTRKCGDASKALKHRLVTMKVNDPTTRNSTSLWRLTKDFTGSYVTLLMLLKPNRALVADASAILHPTHKLISEAVGLIRDSPWEKLQEDSLPPSQMHSRAPTPVQNYPPPIHTQMVPPPIPHPSMATHQHYQHRRPNGSNGSTNGSAISPQSGIPATPMSAALGPAAQSTVPKTPASGTSGGSMSSMFEGNVFQRADNLLSQQTMYRRPSAAP